MIETASGSEAGPEVVKDSSPRPPASSRVTQKNDNLREIIVRSGSPPSGGPYSKVPPLTAMTGKMHNPG